MNVSDYRYISIQCASLFLVWGQVGLILDQASTPYNMSFSNGEKYPVVAVWSHINISRSMKRVVIS